MSWLSKIPPWSWRLERDRLRAQAAVLQENVHQLRDELVKVGEREAERFPVHVMYEPEAQITPDVHREHHVINVTLRPVGVRYVLPHRHLLGAESVEAFTSYISVRLGNEFAKLLTQEWIKQGVIKQP